ncbi:MAG TPA: hypothetical protein VNX88_03080 [Terriglobales bacterium]|jgi:hypothetical protein|nr:hypothetical protein [Terriglobales bacterium]
MELILKSHPDPIAIPSCLVGYPIAIPCADGIDPMGIMGSRWDLTV